MKLAITNLDNQEVGSIELSETVFGLPVRKDLLARMVNYQLAKRRAGTHSTKEIGDVSGRRAKPYKQKGTGRARQGSLRSPQFRGGAIIFGPHPRSHAFDLQKKVRKLALKTALFVVAFFQVTPPQLRLVVSHKRLAAPLSQVKAVAEAVSWIPQRAASTMMARSDLTFII